MACGIPTRARALWLISSVPLAPVRTAGGGVPTTSRTTAASGRAAAAAAAAAAAFLPRWEEAAARRRAAVVAVTAAGGRLVGDTASGLYAICALTPRTRARSPVQQAPQQQQASDSTPMAGETTCATEVKKKTTSPIHPELAAHFERRRNSSSTEKPLADDFGIRDLLKSLAAATEDPKSPKKAGSSSVSSPATTEERISGDAGSSSNRSPEKRRRRKRGTHQPTPVRVFSRMYSRCLSDVEGRGKLLRYINKRAAHLLRYFNAGDTRRSDGGGGSPKGGDDSGGDEKEETRLSVRDVDPLELFKTAVVEDQEGEAEELMLYVVILARKLFAGRDGGG